MMQKPSSGWHVKKGALLLDKSGLSKEEVTLDDSCGVG